MIPIGSDLLLYGAVFVTALLLLEGLYFLIADWRGGPRERRNRRLRLLAAGKSTSDVLYKLRHRGIAGDRGGVRGRVVAMPVVKWVDRMLVRAGLEVLVERFLAGVGIAAGLIYLALDEALHRPTEEAAFGALVFGIALPLFVLSTLAHRRIRRFALQFPDAIDTIVRSLRAGHPVATAIGMVAREMNDPVGSEFGIVHDEMTYGLELREALENLAQRIGTHEVHYMVVSIKIQHGTGGNLAEVLAGLSHIIRDRERMRRKVLALSAEARLSAVLLSLMPFIVAGGLYVIRPEYYLEFLHDRRFQTMMTIGLAGVVVGILVMYRLVKFRV